MKKKLLFVTYGGGHAHMVYPVVHALRDSAEYKSGSLDIQVLGLPAAKATLKANGVDCFGFGDILDKDRDADAIARGQELAREHHSPTVGIPLEESVAYLGLCYQDLVVRLGKEQAARLFKEKARQSFYPLSVMERILDHVRPDMVITSNSPRSEAAAIETANKRGLETLIMTDLFTGLGGYVLKAKSITFLNEFAKNMFAADGLLDDKASEFYYTGNPAFDKILKLPRDKDAAWMRRHFPEAQGRKIVLHADTHSYWHPPKKCSYFKTDQEILEELDACYRATLRNEAVYLVRPHPAQDRALYRRWLEGRKDAHLAADCNLHELLRNIDLMLVRTSTVGLEASYMQKRVVQLDADFHTDLPLAKMGIAWGVNRYDELPGAIREALADDTKFEQIKAKAKQVLPAEPASAKIAGIILDKTSGRSRRAATMP